MDEFQELNIEVLLDLYENGDVDLDFLIGESKALGISKARVKALLKARDIFDDEEWSIV